MDADFIAFLDAHLSYDANTGSLIWAISLNDRICRGDAAGCLNSTGHRVITLAGQKLTGAKVAWCLHHKEWPRGRVYAKNGDPSDLRLCNLTLDNPRSAGKIDLSKRHTEWTLADWAHLGERFPDAPELKTPEGVAALKSLRLKELLA